ncbi:MAG: hypothetical protein AB7V43_11900 [Acidimicrobiia bacterium]
MAVLAVLAACSGGGSEEASTTATATIVEAQIARSSNAAVADDAVSASTVASSPADDSGASGDTVPQDPTTFVESFSGAPASPTAWDGDAWDVVVHSRGTSTRDALEPMAAMHGHDCAGPPATHEISSYDDAVFQCRDHVMTSIRATDYGLIYLTPARLVDMSNGSAVVSWDMSTARTTLRDWVDLWITPFEDNMILPFDSSDPDLQGPPRNGVHVRMDQFDGKTIFKVTIYKDFQVVDVPDQRWWQSYDEVLTPDAARRDRFELIIGRDHLKFGMPAYGLWWADTAISDLGFDTGVVQFGHHSYNPTKDCASCTPNTWHWDNVKIAPSKPFTIIGTDRRLVDEGTDTNVMHLDDPAPSGSFLRFSGQGDAIEISTDGGQSWSPAVMQRHREAIRPEHAASYWTPVPAGVTTVAFRGAPGFVVRDVSVFSTSTT